MNIIFKILKRFVKARENARRFHGEAVGKDVDPNRCFGDFLVRVARQDAGGIEKVYGVVKTALAESSGTSGGYLVPTEFHYDLLGDVAERSLFRPRAMLQPMASASLLLPVIDATTVQAAGVSPFFGGMQMIWTAEAQTRTENEPKFRDLELRAWELSGYSLSSNPMLQDGGLPLEAYLRRLFADATVWFEDYAFLQGNGVGKPLGILNANATISVTRGTGGQVVIADIAKMAAKLLPLSWERALWIVHPTTWQYIVQFGSGAWQINQPLDTGPGKPHGTLNGQPLFVSEKAATLGSRGDVMLIDPALYVIGDRMQVEVDASEHVNFLTNQMTFRITERIDGQPYFNAPITLQDAASTVSPFVVLQ